MMIPPGGMPPQPMPQEQVMPQAPPDPAQMHAAVIARLEEIEIENWDNTVVVVETLR